MAALDVCHVPIIAPLQSPEDYVNRKGFHAVTLQGLVDSNYRFVDILVGWPVKVHDMRVFKNSQLFFHCCARTFLLLQLSRVISGVRVPPSIVGDSAYALSDWLMKPYTDNGNLTREQVNFNKILSVTRVVVENAYGRLNGRFRCIAKRLDLNVETVCLVIAACCVLHNFCEVMGEDFNEEWLQGVQLHLGVFPVDPNQGQNRNTVAIREAIKTSLL